VADVKRAIYHAEGLVTVAVVISQSRISFSA
jgi:hypothetical protein